MRTNPFSFFLERTGAFWAEADFPKNDSSLQQQMQIILFRFTLVFYAFLWNRQSHFCTDRKESQIKILAFLKEFCHFSYECSCFLKNFISNIVHKAQKAQYNGKKKQSLNSRHHQHHFCHADHGSWTDKNRPLQSCETFSKALSFVLKTLANHRIFCYSKKEQKRLNPSALTRRCNRTGVVAMNI